MGPVSSDRTRDGANCDTSKYQKPPVAPSLEYTRITPENSAAPLMSERTEGKCK